MFEMRGKIGLDEEPVGCVTGMAVAFALGYASEWISKLFEVVNRSDRELQRRSLFQERIESKSLGDDVVFTKEVSDIQRKLSDKLR